MLPASYHTRSFVTGSLAGGIALVTVASLFVLSLLIMAGVPMMLTYLLFLASVFAGVMSLGGDSVYRVDDQGVAREVTTMLFKRVKRQRFPWAKVRCYQTGRDMNRSWDEYDFLEIGFRRPRHRWKLTNQHDAIAFARFQQTFEAGVERENRRREGKRPIQRTISFFETRWAMLFTLACYLFLVVLGMVYLAAPELLDATHLIRLLLVILPGVAYLTYRVFIEPRRKRADPG